MHYISSQRHVCFEDKEAFKELSPRRGPHIPYTIYLFASLSFRFRPNIKKNVGLVFVQVS